jgi:Tfp pilus assembly protein PilX
MRSKLTLLHHEDGMVLVLCLITLVMLTVIGIAATTTSRREAEVSGNDKTYKEALYAAEMAVTAGETVVENLLSRVDLNEDTVPGHYARGKQPAWHDLTWEDEDPNNAEQTAVVTTIPTDLHVASEPRYAIEEENFVQDSLAIGIGVNTGTYRFTVTGRGTGGSDAAQVFVETIYAKRYN